MHGEIIILKKAIEPLSADYLLVRHEDGSASIMEEPLDASTTFANITKNGKIELTAAAKTTSNSLTSIPRQWPFLDESGCPMAPKTGTVVQNVGEKAVILVMPADAIGWIYLDINHVLNGPPKGCEPFKNVIWVYRESDGGLRLVHSGPDRQGLYATVSRDGILTFSDMTDIKRPGPGEAYYWDHFSYEDGMPITLEPEGGVKPIPEKTAPDKIFVTRSGGVCIPGGMEE
jgi:hypothetical protein